VQVGTYLTRNFATLGPASLSFNNARADTLLVSAIKTKAQKGPFTTPLAPCSIALLSYFKSRNTQQATASRVTSASRGKDPYIYPIVYIVMELQKPGVKAKKTKYSHEKYKQCSLVGIKSIIGLPLCQNNLENKISKKMIFLTSKKLCPQTTVAVGHRLVTSLIKKIR